MIKSRIRIGNGDIFDTYTRFGFIYMSADNRMEAPVKKHDTISYAEKAGEYFDPRTVQDVFDYKVRFIIECPNKDMDNANVKIAEFNRSLYTLDGDIRTYKKVTFYDDYKRVIIVGFPEPISELTNLYRRQDGSVMDCAEFELTIHVSNPAKCFFASEPITLNITTNGTEIFVHTSKPLSDDQSVVVMERGRATSCYWKGEGDALRRTRQKSALRWHVPDGPSPFHLNANNSIVQSEPPQSLFERYSWSVRGTNKGGLLLAVARKASDSNFCIPYETGRTAKITFGVAIYEYGNYGLTKKRVSNVCYFRSNVKVVDGDDRESGMEQWFSI